MHVDTFTGDSTATGLQIRSCVVVALFLLETAPAAADAAAPAAGHADQGQGLGSDQLDAGDHFVAESLQETLHGANWNSSSVGYECTLLADSGNLNLTPRENVVFVFPRIKHNFNGFTVFASVSALSAGILPRPQLCSWETKCLWLSCRLLLFHPK